MNKFIFTEKQIENFVGFCNELKRVHIRLIKEGYKISEGKITPPEEQGMDGSRPV